MYSWIPRHLIESMYSCARDCSSQIVASSIRGYHPLRPASPSKVLLIAEIQVLFTNLYWRCIRPAFYQFIQGSPALHRSVILSSPKEAELISQTNYLADILFKGRLCLDIWQITRGGWHQRGRGVTFYPATDASVEVDWCQPCANIAFRCCPMTSGERWKKMIHSNHLAMWCSKTSIAGLYSGEVLCNKEIYPVFRLWKACCVGKALPWGWWSVGAIFTGGHQLHTKSGQSALYEDLRLGHPLHWCATC